jgi:murein DD-endopeptidase MepM/ murein hydrolase activator NlpD
MRFGRTRRPSPGVRPRPHWLARRLWHAGLLRSWRPSTLGLVLVWVVAALVAPRAALAVGVAPAPSAAGAVGARSQPPLAQRPSRLTRVPPLWPPVVGPLVRGYEAPAEPYGPGHRGVDIAAVSGVAVWAPAAGRVVFAGGVAGTAWASIEVGAGVVITLGPLRALAVTRGQRVATGTRIADLAPGHGSGGYPTRLHLGLRVDGVYVDPLPWLTGFARPRLAPLREPGGPH